MRILDEQDNEIQESDLDYTKGYIVKDWYCVAHHPEIPASGPVTHWETLFCFDDGTEKWMTADEYSVGPKDGTYTFNDEELNGKTIVTLDTREVEDEPFNPGQHEWFENEEILRYKVYTEDELLLMEARDKQRAAENGEKEARRSEYRNLLKSMDDVVLTLADSEGVKSDIEDQINDINLALADLMGA